jgi:hypothetical protein
MGSRSLPVTVAYKSILIYLAPGVGKVLQKMLSVLLADRIRVVSLPEESRPEKAIEAACGTDSPCLLITDSRSFSNVPTELKRLILGELSGPARALSLFTLDHRDSRVTGVVGSRFVGYDLGQILRAATGNSPVNLNMNSVFQPNRRALIKLLTHDFPPMIKVAKDYFEELYTLSVDWLPRIFGGGEEWSRDAKERLKGEIKEAIAAKNEGLLANIIKRMSSLLDAETCSTPRDGAEEPGSYLEMFMENTAGLIRTIRSSMTELPGAGPLPTPSYSAEAALNFWLCWWVWKFMGFDEGQEILFNNTFYKETFYYIALNAEQMGRRRLWEDLKGIYQKGTSEEVICELENKMHEVTEGFEGLSR